jgi:hypothetical protein
LPCSRMEWIYEGLNCGLGTSGNKEQSGLKTQ